MTFEEFGTVNEMFLALSKHLEFVPYLSIYVIDSASKRQNNPSEPPVSLELIGRLSNFYNLTLLANKPTNKRVLTPDFSNLTGYHRRIYHTLVFAEHEIYNLKTEQHEKSLDLLRSIMDFLIAIPQTFKNLKVTLDESKLYADLIKESENTRRLISFHKFRLSMISRLSNTLSTVEENISELKRMIEIMSLTVDPQTSYFPQHPLQTSFNRVLMTHLLPYRNDITDIINEFEGTDPSMFVDMIFEEVVQILNDLQFTEKRHDMALVLLLYRYIFDRVYKDNSLLNPSLPLDSNSSAFYSQSSTDSSSHENESVNESKTSSRGSLDFDIIGRLRTLPISQLSLPKEYCPPICDETQSCASLFRKDPYFVKAVEALEMAQWHVNPFDILHCVEETIDYIEKAASAYATTPCTVFPFEVTFSLFMAVLLSTQIMNWGNIVDFVTKYTPQTGLAPKFEYARAKMEASKEECLVLYNALLSSQSSQDQPTEDETEHLNLPLELEKLPAAPIYAC